MADIVGLRFVTEGEKTALAALRAYRSGMLDLDKVQDKYVAAFNRRARDEMAGVRRVAMLRQKALDEQRRETERAARAEQQAAQEKKRAAEQAARAIEQAAQREARAQREAAQETARLAAETEMLARAYNPLMAATNVYEREVQQLNRAHQLGVLSADALEAKLGELQVAYARVGDGTMKAQNFVNQFGSVTQLAGVKTNRFGMVAQQVGYQVGDFFVQIQSGTNAFVAFGQQATQLAGLLPGLAGAIVGISISVGTMLLAAYDRTRRAAQEFEDTTFDINEAAKSATEELKSYREELAKLASEYETLGEIGLDKQIKALDAELKNLEGRRAAITGAAATGFGAAGGMMSGADLEEMVGDALRANTEEIDEQIRSKREQLRLLVLERESVEAVKIQLGEQNQLLRDGAAAALDRNSSFRQSRLELERELNLIQMSTQYGEDSVEVAEKRAYYEAVMRGYTEEQRNAYVDLVLRIREAEQALEDSKDATEAVTMAMAAQVTHQQQIATLQMTVNERREAYRKTVDDANRSIKDQIALNMAILQFGEDSQQVEAVRATQAREAYRQQQLAAGIVGNHLKEQMRLYDISVLLAKAIEDSADNAEDLSSAVASTDLSSLASQAALLASNMGVAADEAARYNAALNRQAGIPDSTGQPRLGFGGLGSMEDGSGLGTGFARLGFGNLDEPRLRTRTPMATPSGRGGGGGGGGATAAQDDYLKNLLLEAEQKRRLVGLSEEETRRQEILFELKKRELPLDDARIEKIIQTEAETRKLIEAEQRREQLMQTIENNISSAFMSMVDGSQTVEDAFRNMLRNILLAVYEQQVAEPAARGISNLLSNIVSGIAGGAGTVTAPSGARLQANGGAWSNGVQFFANGGVVNSPTMFGHSSGLGVMGEAGPEAIMPLKRGSDGKLGVAANGGSLTVNVVMDPSTGALGAFVQDQAGQVVAKAAPQLAQYASKTMVDQRRRGGTMKAAFRG
jgi:hypothetical protein